MSEPVPETFRTAGAAGAAPPSVLLFDLDGTLVDSAPSILESFRLAFAACGIEPAVALDARLIGPPLRPTLTRLLGGEADAPTLDRLASAFRDAYDGGGWRATVAYPGLEAVIARLADAGRRLFVVTNKRLTPTRLILDHFGLGPRFEAVYALDAFEPPVADKAAALAVVLARHGLAAADCVYIGDTPEDAAAAAANDLAFIAAGWGYGDPARLAAAAAQARVGTLAELAELLLAPEF